MRYRALALSFLAAAAVAQEPGEPRAVTDAQAALGRGDYWQAYHILDRAAFDPTGKPLDDYTYQMWRQTAPMVTNELPVDALVQDKAPPPPDVTAVARVRQATARPALAEIVRRARATTIVIINEAHYSPRDRAFALEVARALRPLGYRILAAETFDTGGGKTQPASMTRLAADHIVHRSTGYYTNDPVFAGFVRQALDLGYRPVSYESTPAQTARTTSIQGREDGQAENLVTTIFAHDPKAKVLIHVGHGHVKEVPYRDSDGTDYVMMAARLKQLTGIDPLTIDQTMLTDLQPSARATYPVAAAKAGTRDVVLFEGDQPLLVGRWPGVDLQVVHPVRRYRYGRPAWLAALGGHPVPIPAALLPTSGELLVQAFAADAPADAVPIDQVLVRAGVPTPSLMLPRGRVRYATQPPIVSGTP